MDELKEQLRASFPKRWFTFGGINMERILDAIVAVIREGEKVVEQVDTERLTETAVETLAEKERVLGLRNGENLTLDERRRRITVRKWERGGPTNTPSFEAALSYLFGMPTKINPIYEEFLVFYDVQEAGGLINFEVAEEYIRRNKLGTLRHEYRVTKPGESIAFSATAVANVIDFPICGLEMPMNVAITGQIASQSISTSAIEHHNTVDMPITGFEIPMREGG